MSKRKHKSAHTPHVPRAVSSPAASIQYWPWAGVLLLMALCCAVYFPSLSGGFLLDDDLLITQNKLVQSPDGLAKMWFSTEATDYWPVTNSSLWIEWRLWGNNPYGYRAINLILHIATSLLLWVVLARLKIPGAFLAALLFAVHPVNVESVAWIAQRKNLLALLFFLLSIGWYLKSAAIDRWYVFSLISFLLAMLSKGSVAILPVVLLLIDWWRNGRISKADWLRSIPFFAIAAVLTAVNKWFQVHDFNLAVRHASFLERLLGAGAAIWFYLGKAIAPVKLAFVYKMWQIETGSLHWWLPLLAAIALTAVLCYLWFQRHYAWARPALLAWTFFCVALLPVLGFTDVAFMQYSLVADHYQQIALIGVVALAAAAIVAWRNQARPTAKRSATIAAAVVVAGLAVLTFRQSEKYGSAVALYSAAIAENRDSPMLYNQLGNALAEENHNEDAAQCFEQAVQLQPENVSALDNWGMALFHLGQNDEAIKRFNSALTINPDEAAAHNNLALALIKAKRYPEAIEHLRHAVQLQPDHPEFQSNLGTAYLRSEKYQDAIRAFEAALKLDPSLAEAHLQMAMAFAKTGDTDRAYVHYQRAVLLNPQLRSPAEPMQNPLMPKTP